MRFLGFALFCWLYAVTTDLPARGDSFAARWLAPLLIVLSGVLVYSNTFSAPFLFDDYRWIVDRQSTHRWWPPSIAMQRTNRPVGVYTFALNHAVHELEVAGYHVVNLLIHLCSGLLVWGIFRRTFERDAMPARVRESARGLSLAIALLWTVHPLQTQAVTYIVQRLESLMGMFYLATLYTFIRSERSFRPQIWLLLSVVSCGLGMATKEVIVSAPLIVLWYDRLFVASDWKSIWRCRKFYYAGLFSTWGILVWCLLRYQVRYEGAIAVGLKVTPWQYLLTQAEVIVHYLRLCFWPAGQCLDYGWPIVTSLRDVWWEGLLIVGLLLGTIFALVRGSKWSLLGGWFFLILAPSSSFVPIIDAAFEHRMYLPSIAVIAGAVLGLGWCLDRAGRRTVAIGLVVASVVALGATAHSRNSVYRSEASMWRDVFAKAPHHPRASRWLGQILARDGQLDEALVFFERAIELDESDPLDWMNLADALAAADRGDEALAHLEYARSIVTSREFLIEHHQGQLLQRFDRLPEAIALGEELIASHPDDAVGYSMIALLHQRVDPERALTFAREALERTPAEPALQRLYGTLLIENGRAAEALPVLESCLATVENGETRLQIGRALAAMGESERADAWFHEMIEEHQSVADAWFERGCLYEQSDRERAMRYFERAIGPEKDHAGAFAGIGRLLAMSDPMMATQFFEKSLDLNPSYLPAYLGLIKLSLGMNRLAEARAILSAVERNAPRHPLVVEMRAELGVTEDAASGR